jgi:hypothetical protein
MEIYLSLMLDGVGALLLHLIIFGKLAEPLHEIFLNKPL